MMTYVTAQQRFENRDSRLVLLKRFFDNLANLVGLHGALRSEYEITPASAKLAATYLYLVESLTLGLKEERLTTTVGALSAIRDANKGANQGGLHDGECHFLRYAIEVTFMEVTADDDGKITRMDTPPVWAFNMGGVNIARAAAAALLGEELLE